MPAWRFCTTPRCGTSLWRLPETRRPATALLAKNDIAKQFGIRTGQVLWEARQQCPGLVCVPAHYERYLAFSARARDIYTSYTDQVESFGLDECWLDVTGRDRPLRTIFGAASGGNWG